MIWYQNDRTFRSIWTDGRGFPDPDIGEPRWYGYSIGRWEDNNTLVVDTTGIDERTWIDNAGCPHSGDDRYGYTLDITTPDSETILILVRHRPNVNQREMKGSIDAAKVVIQTTAKGYGWDNWVKVRQDVQPIP